MFRIFAILLLTYRKSVLGDNIIDVDDILTEEYMPTTLMVLENPEEGVRNFNETLRLLNNGNGEKIDGSFNNAMDTMNFHRNMMNQYLCRSYVAEQIISEMSSQRVKRRMAHVTPGSIVDKSKKMQLDVSNELIQDEGSSNYKNWLSKSTTLEDIYRHYNNRNADKRNDIQEEDHEELEEYFEENVGNYQQHQPEPSGDTSRVPTKKGNSLFPSYHYSSSDHSGGGHNGFDVSGHEDLHEGHISFGGHDHEHILHHNNYYPPKYHGKKYDKDYDLSELFEIALTALAYLSFGMFLVHVIMCISTTNNSTATPSVMMPMSMSPTATATGGAGTSTGSMGTTMTGTDGGTTGNDQSGTMPGTTGNGDNGDGGNGDGMNGGSTSPGDDGTSPDTGGTSPNSGGTSPDTGGTSPGVDGTSPDGSPNGDNTSPGGDGTNPGGTGTDDGFMGGTTSTGDGGADSTRDTLNFRFRRDIPSITNPDNKVLNELARRVLTSIEAALIANSDDGNCLRRSLCENNRYSRSLGGNHKIMVPILNLGMSWLSGRLIKAVPSSTAMLDSLKASILGLGKANCETIYQNCDLRTEKRNRRRKKRK